MRRLAWSNVAHLFEHDGSLIDIYLAPAGVEGWQRVLDAIREDASRTLGATCSYFRDGEPEIFDWNAARCFTDRERAQTLKIKLDDIQINSFFFCEDIIEFDIWPAEIKDQATFERLRDFIDIVSDAAGTRALVTPEGCMERPMMVKEIGRPLAITPGFEFGHRV